MGLSWGNIITTLQRMSTSNRVAPRRTASHRVALRRTRRSVEIEVAGHLRQTAPWRLSQRLRDSVPLAKPCAPVAERFRGGAEMTPLALPLTGCPWTADAPDRPTTVHSTCCAKLG